MNADLVIAGGRLVDPLSGFDAVADIAITAGQITEIGAAVGGKRLDAAGLIVACMAPC